MAIPVYAKFFVSWVWWINYITVPPIITGFYPIYSQSHPLLQGFTQYTHSPTHYYRVLPNILTVLPDYYRVSEYTVVFHTTIHAG